MKRGDEEMGLQLFEYLVSSDASHQPSINSHFLNPPDDGSRCAGVLAAVVTPVVLAYSAFAYWVIRGRTVSWFFGIYILSLGAYALVVLFVKSALHLLQ
jgi:hypothetical protein